MLIMQNPDCFVIELLYMTIVIAVTNLRLPLNVLLSRFKSQRLFLSFYLFYSLFFENLMYTAKYAIITKLW